MSTQKVTRRSILGIAAILVWLLIFFLGIFIDSSGFRDEIMVDGKLMFSNIFNAFLTYTVTNVALLCMTAGIAGANLYSLKTLATKNEATDDSSISLMTPVFNGMIRAFFVYLLFLSGAFMTANAPFEAPTQDQYVRVAGSLSILSFLVGYFPSAFNRLLERMSSSLRGSAEGKKKEVKKPLPQPAPQTYAPPAKPPRNGVDQTGVPASTRR